MNNNNIDFAIGVDLLESTLQIALSVTPILGHFELDYREANVITFRHIPNDPSFLWQLYSGELSDSRRPGTA